MSKESIVQALEVLLRQHKTGVRGSAQQEPYKGDFFRQFAEAFNEGLFDHSAQSDLLTPDALLDSLTSRSPELLKLDAWHTLHACWREWAYAWRHTHLKLDA